MKKIILKAAAAATAAMMFPAAITAYAQKSIPLSAKDVKELIWEHTLDKDKDCDEILSLEYKDKNDLNSSPVRLGDLIDPKKSVREGLNSEEDWKVSSWLCADKNESGKYYTIYFERGDDGSISVGGIAENSFDYKNWYGNETIFSETAELINENLSGNVLSIGYTGSVAGIETDNGSYIVHKGEYSASAEPVEGFTVVDEHTLLTEKTAYESYKKENDELRGQWFLEAAEKISAIMPDIEFIASEDDYAEDVVNTSDVLSPYAEAHSGYSDVSDEYAPYVRCLEDMGIMNGTGDGEFMPGKIVTRAEMAAVMSRAFNLEPIEGSSFSDVAEDFWAAPYINAFAELGVLEGTGDGRFMPDEPVTYNELFKTAVFMMGHKYFDNDYYPHATNVAAMENGYADNLGDFSTDSGVTRLNLAVILCNMLDSQLYTENLRISFDIPGVHPVTNVDIPLSQYLRGEPLQCGTLIRGSKEYDEWIKYSQEAEEQARPVMDELNEKLKSRYFMQGWIF